MLKIKKVHFGKKEVSISKSKLYFLKKQKQPSQKNIGTFILKKE